jgi:2,3-bisphosphoglycerate-independent phosphoglycerate mutase
MNYRPTVLVILDGWGIGPDYPGNAVIAASTPNMDRLQAAYPVSRLRCSGEDVGLPEGQMGNSEVGHLNLGAGFVVYQWITRIDSAIADGSFFENESLRAAVEHAREHNGKLHLIGLVGDGGVHAHDRHLIAALELCARAGLHDIVLHAITDGRDTSPTSGAGYVRNLLTEIERVGVGRIGTVSGRYYAMDRDRRWERAALAFDAIVHANGPAAPDPLTAITRSYDEGVTDEFIRPTVIDGGRSAIGDGDSVIMFNFRADRMRQLTHALADASFDAFDRGRRPDDLLVTTLTEYEANLPARVAFPPVDVTNPIARVVSDAGLRQFHAAETEKYAHVTYFFNGGREEPFPGEERALIPSPKVATYDLQPEMSAPELTDATVAAIGSGDYAFVIMNYANGDMVGHTGVFEAAVRAIEVVDECVGRIVDATLAAGGAALVTADHGNADEMLVPGTDEVWTAHTLNPVPVVLISPDESPARQATLRPEGRLSDIAPTLLQLLGLEPAPEMTGVSLLEPDDPH